MIHVFPGTFDSSELEAITISSNITRLSSFAFRNTKLEEVIIPDTVQEVDTHLFENCRQLRKVRLPNHMDEIPFGFFAGCVSLTDFNFPQNTTKISMKAFAN